MKRFIGNLSQKRGVFLVENVCAIKTGLFFHIFHVFMCKFKCIFFLPFNAYVNIAGYRIVVYGYILFTYYTDVFCNFKSFFSFAESAIMTCTVDVSKINKAIAEQSMMFVQMFVVKSTCSASSKQKVE